MNFLKGIVSFVFFVFLMGFIAIVIDKFIPPKEPLLKNDELIGKIRASFECMYDKGKEYYLDDNKDVKNEDIILQVTNVVISERDTKRSSLTPNLSEHLGSPNPRYFNGVITIKGNYQGNNKELYFLFAGYEVLIGNERTLGKLSYGDKLDYDSLHESINMICLK